MPDLYGLSWPFTVATAPLRAFRVASSRPISLLVLGCCLVAGAVIASAVFLLFNLRDRAIANSERQLQNIAVVLSVQTERTLHALELVESSVIQRIQSMAVASSEDFDRRLSGHDTHEMLKDKISNLPQIDAVLLINSRGTLISSSQSWPASTSNSWDQADFDAVISNSQSPSFISQPLRKRGTGAWTVFLVHRITGPNDELLGMILGTIPLRDFEELYRSLDLGDGSSNSLFRRDGILLARHPHVDASIGRSVAAGPLFKSALANADRGVSRQTSQIDKHERLIAAATVPHYPLVVTATRTVPAILADWRTQARYLIGLAATLVIVVGGTGAVMVLRFREQTIRLDAALNNMCQGLAMFDSQQRVVVINRRLLDLYGLSPEQVKPGITLRQLIQLREENGTFVGDADAYVRDVVTNLTKTGFDWSVAPVLPDGRMIAVVKAPMPMGGWVETYEDITERKRAEAQVAYLSRHDPLTCLPNRAAFSEHLTSAIERATRENGKFALLSVDLDRFKEINDVFGHDVGDSLLREVARRFELAAADVFLAHLGGDEFVVLSAQEPQPAATEALAERLQAALSADIVVGEQLLRINSSLGVAIFPADGTDAASILANAQAALDRAKADGRSSIRFFDAVMDQRLRDCRALQHDLRLAAAHREIVVHYQPQARIGGEVVGFEALVRWQHPIRGMISPGAFISIAEESGLIIPLGEWVLREACREAASWSKPLAIAVNLSPVQFRFGDLASTVLSALMETGLSPGRLELEITEGLLITDYSRALTILRQIKNLGVKIAMDDFGTGYSSLSYLQAFPFDKIKIDRSFITNVQTKPQSAAIVRSVIGLGRGLNVEVIAEGVETQDELDFLAKETCDEVQGYLVGYAAPIEEYADLVGGKKVVKTIAAAK